MRGVLFMLALLAVTPAARGSVTTVVVTKDNQQKQGVDFTLTAEQHPDPTLDTVYVRLRLAKKGKLERLGEVVLQVKDGNRLALRVPVELKPDGDGWVAAFHMDPAQVRRAELRLTCPSPVPTAVTTYDIRLDTYLDR